MLARRTRIRRTLAVAGTATAALLTVLVATSGDSAASNSSKRAPNPQPALYLTAASPQDLQRQAHDAGARFARSQGAGASLLVLDFGAARLKGGTYGSALRSGTFFSNDDIQAALQAAARGYRKAYKRGSVTIVYANTNAYIGRPGSGYTPFNERIARQAGKQQGQTVTNLKLYPHESATVGGDIEPGYDEVAKPDVAIAMVAAAAAASPGTYYDFGTAPCGKHQCVNGWTPRDVCQVAAGSGRRALPEIYFSDAINQPAQWAIIEKVCRIKAFAGVSASPIGTLTPRASWRTLGTATSTEVGPIIVVWPG